MEFQLPRLESRTSLSLTPTLSTDVVANTQTCGIEKASNDARPASQPLPQLSNSSPLNERDGQLKKFYHEAKPWLQVTGSFFPYMNAWGLLNSYGVFQHAYLSQLLANEPASKISWIGSMQAFLLLLVGVLTGPGIDAGYTNHIILLGTVLLAFGLMMTSICTQYYQFMLAQGVVVGIGTGCIFLPSITVVPQWFDKKRSTPLLGVVATGSSIGGIIFPIMFKSIESQAGFGWAVRAIAFVTIPTNLFAALVMRTKALPPKRRVLVDLTMFREGAFRLLCLSAFFAFIGLYIPIFFIQQYALTHTAISSNLAAYIVPILMAGSLPGRLLPNLLAAKFGNLHVDIAITGLCALLCFCWLAVKSSVGGLFVFAILYGFASGAYVSLLPPLIVSLAPNMQKIGTRIGMTIACAGFGVLAGNPVAGAILGNSDIFVGLQCFAGAALMLSTVLLIAIKIHKDGLELGRPDGKIHIMLQPSHRQQGRQ